MKTLLLFSFISLLSFTAVENPSYVNYGDNYKVLRSYSTSSGKAYEIRCTDCGKDITVYYTSSTGRYARGSSTWYTQYRSLETAAENGCEDRCD
ncbi:MAG: hypothetical protein AAFY76_00215 [Cyanobacteria bacterium J06649_11]